MAASGQVEEADVVVIGSGFGGSVAALRLAEAGMSVIVLERGKWWKPEDFPRTPLDCLRKGGRTRVSPDGLYDVHIFDGVTVYCGNGVGGGSLVYSNVMRRPPRDVLDLLPPGFQGAELEPSFSRVQQMLSASPPPTMPPKSVRLRTLAAQIGAESRWQPMSIAVNHERCVGCGLCNLGCHVGAKNTLDRTYLVAAMQAGARIRARWEVTRIAADAKNGGYRVWVKDWARRDHRVLHARRVVVSAGVVGTTELLLRARESGDLPRLSAAIGTRFSPNGDHASFGDGAPETCDEAQGAVMVSGIDFGDVCIEDCVWQDLLSFSAGVMPAVELAHEVMTALRRGGIKALLPLAKDLRERYTSAYPPQRTLTLGVMARDAADGRAFLRPDGRMDIRWRWDKSAEVVRRVNDLLSQLSKAAGLASPLPGISPSGRARTVHPLGGCPLGESARDAVIGADGEAFGHPGLYVMDGSIIPVALGVNPGLTIASMSEVLCARIIAQAAADRGAAGAA